MFSEKI